MRRLALFLVLALVACRADKLDVQQLKLPPGFHIAIAGDTEKCGARALAWSPGGTLLTTCVDEGEVLALPGAEKGSAEHVVKVLTDLSGPHGIAFHNGKLYVAETQQLVAYDWDQQHLRASNPHKVADLPSSGGGHMTRTIVFHGGRIYISAGSSCNVCKEDDPRRAAVMQFNEDGSGMRIFASGLRNAVAMTENPKTNSIWVADMGVDWLGDDAPTENVYELSDSGFYGWPYCYGDRTPNTKFDPGAGSHCGEMVRPKVQLQAHSAPLSIAFGYDAQMFPPEYRNSMYISFHGSWNRSVPTGYKVVRVPLDDKGRPAGPPQDFVTGWLAPGERRKGHWMGRPVGLAFGADGSLFIADDASGHVYRVTYSK